MTELSLHSVEEGLLKLVDDQGNEYELPASEEVFAAVRRVRAHTVTGHQQSGHVRPKVIQALIRSGMSAEDVAADTGAHLDQVRQYAGPVLAERRHIAYQAGQCPVVGSRALADVVEERLAARHVETSELEWDAWRKETGSWHVELSYHVGDHKQTAVWEYRSGSVIALGDEATWLSDDGPTDSGPIPNYGTAHDRVFNVDADDHVRDVRDPQSETGRILESLRRRKNETQPIIHSVPDTPPVQPDGAHTALSRPQDAYDDTVIAAPLDTEDDTSLADQVFGTAAPKPAVPEQAQPPREAVHIPGEPMLPEPSFENLTAGDEPSEDHSDEPKKKGRSSVPSWDEIMFGKKD